MGDLGLMTTLAALVTKVDLTERAAPARWWLWQSWRKNNSLGITSRRQGLESFWRSSFSGLGLGVVSPMEGLRHGCTSG